MATFSEALKNIKNRSVKAARNVGFNEHFLPTLGETAARLPEFKGSSGGNFGNAARFVGNMGVGFVNNVIGRGIIDPTIDFGQNVGRTIQGRDPLEYEQLRSPISRLGYNAMGQNANPQELMGNMAGVALPVVDAYTGGKSKALLKSPSTLLGKMNEGARIGGPIGAAMGGLQGLEDGRDQSLGNQLTGAGMGAGLGLIAGRVLGAGLPVVGAAYSGATRAIRRPGQIVSQAQNAIKNTPRQLTDPSLTPSGTLVSNLNLPGFQRKVRFNDPSLSKELEVGDSLFRQNDGTWAIKKAGRKAEEIANAQAVNDKYADTLEQYGYGSFRRNQDGSMTFTPKSNIATLESRLPNVPDYLKPLYDEAKNYKSVDEFVKAQPKVFHGTNAVLGEFKPINTKRPETLIFTTNKVTASAFGKELNEVAVDIKKPFVFDAKGEKIATGRIREIIKQNDINPADNVFSPYDGLVIKNAKGYEGEEWMIPFRNDAIKTKSQLIDIYNKATKGDVATLETRLPEVPDNRVFVRTEPRAKGQLVKPPVPKIPDEIMNSQRGAEVYQEMVNAAAGKRFFNETGSIGQSSTFPSWVSPSLRDRKLFDEVQSNLLEGKVPRPGSRAGDLYSEVYRKMTGASPEKAQRALATAEPTLNDLNATLPARPTPTGKVRKIKADPEFESLIKSVTQEERFDRAINFGKMRSEGKPINPLLGSGEELQDITSVDASFKNVQRIFRKVFGKGYENAKRAILDPFDASKGKWIDEQNNLANSLKTDVIDRLGIKPKSKESELVQKFGEKEMSLQELQAASPKWQQIVEADKWFRSNYDRLLDEVNGVRAQIYGSNSDKIIPRRRDYYRHFQELSGFEGLMNRLTGPANIPTELAGISDAGTRPKSKFLSFAQKRLGNRTEYDAVSGFLQYAKAAAYAKHIDPQINNFRKLADDLRTTSVATENPMLASRFTEFLEDYANTLSGKTNPFDRGLQKMLGRPIMNSVDWLNSRVKANVILGNLSSSVAQAGNLPQIGANAGYKNLAKGMADTMLGINKPTKAINQSTFIKERYAKDIADRFDTSLLGNTKKMAVWVTQALDEVATKAGWHAFYRQAQEQGIKNPTNYADNMVRDMVGGRGVGEVALAQQSRVTQLVAPFMIEVQNLWHVLGDNVGKKEFGKIVKFAIGAYAFNRTAEQIRGSGVTFDPIEAVLEAVEAYSEEENKGVAITRAGGRLAGEVLSNVMFGSTAAEFYPEYGMDIAGERVTREELFGDKDPTRFGSGLLGVVQGGIKDPLYKVLPPFGGNQLKKTIEGIKTANRGYSETSTGRVRFPVDQNARNRVQSAIFGQYSVPQARSYFDKDGQPLGDEQSEIFKQLSPEQRKEFYDSTMSERVAKKADDKMIASIKAPDKNKAVASGTNDIVELQSGKFYSKSLDKKYDSQLEAETGVAKEKFKQSGKNIEVYGDTVFRRNEDGSVKEQPKLEYDYSLNTIKMESLKKNKDLKGWSELAEKQVAIIEQQLQDPSLDELEQASLLKKAAALTDNYQKYKGYGGFKKPKVRKPGVQEAAQFALDTDRMTRSGDWQGWTQAAQQQVNYLEGLKKSAKNQTELLQITNKQEDLQAKIAKINQQRGFVKPPAMPSISLSMPKMPSSSLTGKSRVVAPPARRASKIQRIVRRPRVSGSQLASMR